jgi:hypothetical protein
MRKLVLVLAACAVGVAFSLGFASRGQTRGEGNANCATLAVPANSDHELVYDPQTGYLHIHYYGRSGHLEGATVDANDPACRSNPGIGRAIEHARAAANDLLAGECAQFKALLSGAPVVAKGGIKPNLAAAKKYVDQEC